MVNSRQKGARGEREWRDVLRSAGWHDAARGQQFHGGPGSPDVVGGPLRTHCETKFGGVLDIYGAMEQSIREAGPGEMPYVAFRRVRRGQKDRGWVVLLCDLDFFELIRLREEKIRERGAGKVAALPAHSQPVPTVAVAVGSATEDDATAV